MAAFGQGSRVQPARISLFDSYGLSWRAGLSTSVSKRVVQLRGLLEVEGDPISRHFVHASLESDLYSLREVPPAMLDEYDAASTAHDLEMDSIRPALTCAACGRSWERPIVRGRKPKKCPECIAGASPGSRSIAVDSS